MRNFKRIISLMTVLVMLAAFVTVPAFAAETLTVHGTCKGTCGSAGAFACNLCGVGGSSGATCGKTCYNVAATKVTTCDGCTVVTPYSAGGSTGGVASYVPGAASLKVAGFQYLKAAGDSALTTQTLADADPALAADAYVKLDIANEKLEIINSTVFDVAGYAINAKWKAGAPSEADLKKFFDKGGTLEVTDIMATKAKDGASKGSKGAVGVTGSPAVPESSPGAGDGVDAVTAVTEEKGEPCGIIVKFTKVEARPKALKLVPNYLLGAASVAPSATVSGSVTTWSDTGTWTLSEAKKTTEYENLDKVQFVQPSGKKPTAEEWAAVGEDTFEPQAVPAIGTGDKVGGKVLYFIKQQAYEKDGKYYAASKESKVSVTALGKAPKLKPNYKTGDLKLKAGVGINATVDAGVWTWYADTALATAANWTRYAKTANSDASKGPVSVALPVKDKMPLFEVGATPKDVIVFTFATAKKPASLPQTIKIAPMAAKPVAGDFSITVAEKNGAVKIDKGDFEFKAKIGDAKWGGPPKLTPAKNGTATFVARLKSTAKAGKPDEANVMPFENTAASLPVIVTITWVTTPADTAAGTPETWTGSVTGVADPS